MNHRARVSRWGTVSSFFAIRSGRWLIFALAAAVLPSGVLGLSSRTTAGMLDGESISVGQVDDALGGAIAREWQEIDRTVRAAATAICSEQELQRTAAERGITLLEMKARIWRGTTPDAEMLAKYRADNPESAIRSANAVAHGLHVRRYRAALEQLANAAEVVSFRIGPKRDQLDREPAYPAIVADCGKTKIRLKEVENFANFPLYRSRAGIVAAICRQFDVGDPNSLLARHIANVKGSDPAKGECSLSLPEPPVVTVRGVGPSIGPIDAMPVRYFGTFDCNGCLDSLQSFLELRERYGDRVRIEFRHHFAESSVDPFNQARAAVCAHRQDSFWGYLRLQLGPGKNADPARALVLDRESFTRCMTDARSAVAVLDDTAEALRLGFEEAIPSWVIGVRPRRGFQGERVLAETIER